MHTYVSGNKNIAQPTSEENHELRIDVGDWDGNTHYAVYGIFSIGDASTKYELSISYYSGNAGRYNEIFCGAKEEVLRLSLSQKTLCDGMSYFNGMKFTTYDQDNDKHSRGNCADYSTLKGGWWYNNCFISTSAMLNGHYTHRNSTIQGIRYRTLGKISQKKSTMKILKV
ncbi:unnamed protein product [Mytilus coruscus]|uniref:Fibrinogen C-terminal domain-containing protein n=1 Tax=Mytilus coruscus TaxID=42192 RepID=A0A6J8C5P3_MYTCO|nr:unnamed protein product [Mytilus coruscus]